MKTHGKMFDHANGKNKYKSVFLFFISYTLFFCYFTKKSFNSDFLNHINHLSTFLLLIYFYILIFIHVKVDEICRGAQMKRVIRVIILILNLILTLVLTFSDFEGAVINNIDTFSPLIIGVLVLWWFEANIR